MSRAFPCRNTCEGEPPMAAAGRRRRHSAVCVQHEASCQVFAVIPLIIFAYDREGVEDMLGLSSIEAVDVEHGCVEIRSEQRTALGIPSKRRAFVTHLLSVRLKAPRCVGEFENVGGYPISERYIRLPVLALAERYRSWRGYLFGCEIVHVATAQFLPRHVIENQGGPHRVQQVGLGSILGKGQQ